MRPEVRLPGKDHAFGGRGRGTGIIGPLQRPGETEEITGMHHTHDDLLAIVRDLRHLQAAVNEQEEMLGWLALLKDGFARRHQPRCGVRQQSVQLIVGHPGKQGQRPDDASVNLHLHPLRLTGTAPSLPGET